jgi:hypothetical protein
MNSICFCVICRDSCNKFITCYHDINEYKIMKMDVCLKCFEETKDNWFKEPWKVMPETLEASQDA